MKANSRFRKLLNDNRGYIGTVGSVVAFLIVIIIGVMIFFEIADNIELTSDAANDSKNATVAMASTVFGLLPLVALVVVAAIILGIVLAFGSGGKQGV